MELSYVGWLANRNSILNFAPSLHENTLIKPDFTLQTHYLSLKQSFSQVQDISKSVL